MEVSFSLETGLFEVMKMVDETFRRRYAKVGAATAWLEGNGGRLQRFSIPCA